MDRNWIVIGHRGYRGKFPENSLLAFRKSFEAGADGIEFDIQKSGDGRFFVIHDPSLSRVAGVDRRIDGMNAEEIKEASLESGEKIPELHELLAIVPAGKLVNIELKEETITEEDGSAVLGILNRYLDPDMILVSSFAHHLLPFYKEQGLKIGMLLGERDFKGGILHLLSKIKAIAPQFINAPIEMYHRFGAVISDLLLSLFARGGKKIAFYTVNSGKDMRLFLRKGYAMITDDTDAALAFRKSRTRFPESGRHAERKAT